MNTNVRVGFRVPGLGPSSFRDTADQNEDSQTGTDHPSDCLSITWSQSFLPKHRGPAVYSLRTFPFVIGFTAERLTQGAGIAPSCVDPSPGRVLSGSLGERTTETSCPRCWHAEPL